MKFLKLSLLVLAFSLSAFTADHKYYISVTQIDYVEDKQSVQIISRIFIDDFEKLLRERYDENITLAGQEESASVDVYMDKYLKEKLMIKINGKPENLKFIGKAYDVDIVKCYLEIEKVKHIESIEISNEVLFDVFSEQQNIVKTNINSKQKSVILFPQKSNVLLKFN
ncbi:DUF6702 family protein [Aestuariibaculum suncheonense]|uniref:Peptidase E n=1 Tax=Aestuariibaculum suncheonense TaxID=1028745 RepID=A0A8J6QA39_9FLAO|nr:DUF6702 family protein [Aestuariibaculum suncheonense]MBD0836411.1 peptidase E [Aestuariibaculum suncheonense]